MAYTYCTQRGPTQLLTILTCMTMLHMVGVSPVLALEQPRTLFVVNAPGSKAGAPVAAPVAAPGPAPVLSLHDMVLSALRSAGTFGEVVGVIENLEDTYPIIRPNITFFAPEDNAEPNGFPFNSTPTLMALLNYHTASGNYPLQSLLNLKVGDRIPTVVSEISIVVSNVANPGYQLDNAMVTKPNLFSNTNLSMSVHGVNAIFNTRFYNTAVLGPVPAPAPVAPSGATAPGAASSTSPGTKTDSNDAAHLSNQASFSLVLVGAIALLFPCPL